MEVTSVEKLKDVAVIFKCKFCGTVVFDKQEWGKEWYSQHKYQGDSFGPFRSSCPNHPNKAYIQFRMHEPRL